MTYLYKGYFVQIHKHEYKQNNRYSYLVENNFLWKHRDTLVTSNINRCKYNYFIEDAVAEVKAVKPYLEKGDRVRIMDSYRHFYTEDGTPVGFYD